MINQKTSAFFNPRVLLAFALCLSGLVIGFGAFSNAFAQSRTAKTAAPAPAPAAASASDQFSAADKQGRFVYLIEFAEPGLLARLPQQSGEKRNPNSAEGKAHQARLEAEQSAHLQTMASAVGRNLNPSHYYLATHSGVAARLTPAEADILRSLPGVKSIERERVYQLNTFRGPSLIGADSIWDGTAAPGGVGSRGEGMIVAVLDTGIVQTHPSFANDASCGHGQSGAPNKLISALDCSSATGPGGLCNGANPNDTNGHGTHTASTAAGNVIGTSVTPPPVLPPPFTTMSGVAPCANVRAYKVCQTNSCGGADIQAGMSSVLLHGDVDVMNFSISGGNNPWTDNDRRKLDLVDADVLVSASAGNTSATITDPIGNVAHLGPWVMTVAASTRDGEFNGRLSAAGPGTPPPATQNIAMSRGSDSPLGSPLTDYPIRHFTGQPATAEGCNAGEDGAPVDLAPFPAGFFNGAVALIHRGTCPFTKKIQNAFDAGATMVVIRNNQVTPISMSTPGQPNIPAYSIEQAGGDALVAHVDANPTTATVNFFLDPQQADVLAGFSLRGPSALTSLTKPDITGPGVRIYAAYTGAAGYAYVSGTSMSSPHLAGAATLVRAVQPTWSVPEVKSAIMMTAKKTGTKPDGSTQWDADDVGNGRVDLTKAALAGLVMHETGLNYLNANPASGGDPKTLNIPSMRNMQCAPHCQWTRTVRNTKSTASSWTATANAISAGFNITVSPSNFSFTGAPDETQELTITASPTTTLTGPVAFGEINLVEAGGQSPDAHMTVAIKGEPFVVGAVSRKVHGAAGTFDIPLPLLGTAGLENRTGPVDGAHQMVVTFTSPVTLTGASVVEGTGTAIATPSGSDVIVNLTGVTDIQRITVRLLGVSNGVTTANVDVPMRVLGGDVNANGAVTSSDVGLTKSLTTPGTPDSTNFRADVNANGAINSTDVGIVKSRTGNTLP